MSFDTDIVDTHGAGFILFRKYVSRDEIAEFMHELKVAWPSFDWVDLHMRDAGGETVVAYRVDFKTLSKKMHDRYHQQIIGRLARRFGTDSDKKPKGVKRWSLSNIIKSAT